MLYRLVYRSRASHEHCTLHNFPLVNLFVRDCTAVCLLYLQRERKERKLYSDDWALGDEEIEGYHTFDLDEKINSNKFTGGFVKDMSGVGECPDKAGSPCV